MPFRTFIYARCFVICILSVRHFLNVFILSFVSSFDHESYVFYLHRDCRGVRSLLHTIYNNLLPSPIPHPRRMYTRRHITLTLEHFHQHTLPLLQPVVDLLKPLLRLFP